MYHQDPVVNDLVLTIINDGDGSQCGMSYKQRCQSAAFGILNFRFACRQYSRIRYANGGSLATREQWLTAADVLQSYYREHIKEIA